MTEPRALRVGALLNSSAGGAFGRDSYEDKRVEAIGADWVVARGVDSGKALFAAGSPEDLLEFLL